MPLQHVPTKELEAELDRRIAQAAQAEAEAESFSILPVSDLMHLAAKLVRRAARFYGLDPALVVGKGQLPSYARCRWAVWEALRLRGYHSPVILAKAFGRDHGTVVKAWQKSGSLKVNDPKFSACLDLLSA